MSAQHHLVTDYLRRFDTAAVGIPLPRRTSLRREIRAHLREAVPAGLGDDAAARLLSEFGSPADIVEHEDGQPVLEPIKVTRLPYRRPLLAIGLGIILVIAFAFAFAIALPFLMAIAGAQPTSIVRSHQTGGASRLMSGDAYFDYVDTVTAMKYPLPPGASYPSGVPAGLNSGKQADGVMEFGGGAVVAHFTWLCAWEVEYLRDVKAHDVRGRVSAERMLEWWGDSAWWREADPDGGWNLNVIQPMKMGDPTGVKADVVDSCGQAGIDFSSGSASTS